MSVVILLGVAFAWALVRALDRAWTCDDAFIVFRYARNLVDGLGLVFNAGERVEGFTDFLWVLWMAPSFRLRVSPETWANFWSIACYLGTLGLLASAYIRRGKSLPGGVWPIPVATLAAAAHSDWNIYATSGLETSAFTFFLVAGFFVLTRPILSPHRAAAGGILFGVACLTRPDGLVPAAAAGVFVLFFSFAPLRAAASYAAGVLATCLPLVIFRLWYYGEWFPNTYYAKSASIAWYGQGLHYLSLYAEKYGTVLVGLPVAGAALLLLRRHRAQGEELLWKALWPSFALAMALSLSYTLYVVRIGGDFMYARMLIPATPFFLVLFELGLTACSGAVNAVLLAALGLLPVLVPLGLDRPVGGDVFRYGVADEWAYYSPRKTLETDYRGAILRWYLADLPVRMLAFGSEMRLAYRAEIPLVVEAHGLMDPVIARMTLKERGRVGHEKFGSFEYLIRQRKLQVMFHEPSFFWHGFPRAIPLVPVEFGRVRGLLLRWDPEFVSPLAQRGARIEDFPSFLDAYISTMAGRPDRVVADDYERFKLFYFDGVKDSLRENAFRKRLGLP